MRAWHWLVGLGVLAVLTVGRKALAYVAGKPLELELESIGGGHWLSAPAAKSFLAMRQAAAIDGIKLEVESSFRTMGEQEFLWATFQAGEGNLAARPGFSKHQSGVAVDIDVDASFTSRTYAWLDSNAGRFGFVNTGRAFPQPEPWHWEFRA